MAKYLGVVETAKLIRAVLKESFPGVKFSVRSDKYAGGASIDVSWTDGPNRKQIDDLLRPFVASSFDSMQDLKSSVYGVLDGEQVNFGSDHVMTSRQDSDEAITRAIRQVTTRFAGNFAHDGIDPASITVEGYRRGRLMSMQLSDLHRYGGEDVQGEIRRALSKFTYRPFAAESKTRKRVLPPAAVEVQQQEETQPQLAHLVVVRVPAAPSSQDEAHLSDLALADAIFGESAEGYVELIATDHADAERQQATLRSAQSLLDSNPGALSTVQ